MADRIRVSATGAGISYYPEFLARELGFFADEGLEVETQAPGHGPYVGRALIEETAELALGGIWRPMMYRGRIITFVPFVQLCLRCPTVVVGRRPVDSFQWRDLVGRTALVPDGSPTPFMFIVGLLRRSGVEPHRVHFVQDFLADEGRELFKGGLSDFYFTSRPLSDQLVAEGHGHVVAELAQIGGPVPWSVYYSKPEFLERKDDAGGRFARAILRSLHWINDHEPEAAPGVFPRHFPKHPPERIANAVRVYRSYGMWAKTVRVAEPDFLAWQEMILEARLIDRRFALSDIFDPRPGEWAERNLRR